MESSFRDFAECGIFSLIAAIVTARLIPSISPMFRKANMFGRDLNKAGRNEVPEALGVVSAAVYLVTLFCFIPWRFSAYLSDDVVFPFSKFVEFVCGLLSICCMVFLGFADDVLDLRWRDKLWIPLVATIPLLMVYYITFSSTAVAVPPVLQSFFDGATFVDLGILYYAYMACLSIFATNAINILAGINGLEAGQALLIALSILTHNFVELYVTSNVKQNHQTHAISVYLLLPFVGVTVSLLWYNWYPSRVFVGDTFCYFAGMTFAVCGILGHFSKTMMLFFIPQTVNFVFSVPQLFRLVPCPRHRMPRLNTHTGLLENSYSEFKANELSRMGRIVLRICESVRLVHVVRTHREDCDWLAVSNFTLINLAIRLLGPRHESVLTRDLLVFQALCSLLAFFIRYWVSSVVYNGE